MKWFPALIVVAAFGVFWFISSHGPTTGEPAKTPAVGAPTAAPTAAPAMHVAEPPTASTPADHAPAPSAAPAAPAAKPQAAPQAAHDPDTVFGTVRSPTGRGLGQVRVALIGADGKEVDRTTSATDGRFAFDHVAPGTYSLIANDPDFLYTSADPASVAVEKGRAVEANLALKRGAARVAGVVVDAANKPVPDTKVILTSGLASVSVNTDPKGRFLVNGLAEGTWTVTPEGRSDLARKVETHGPDTGEITIALIKKASLEIRVVGTHLHPVALKPGDATAQLRPAGKSDAATTRSTPVAIVDHDAEGREFERDERYGVVAFKDLEPGQYELEIADAKGISVITGVAAWTLPTPVTLEAGQVRSWPLPTAQSARGLGVEVPFGALCFMIVAIGLMIFVTPILFPPPMTPKRPAGLSAAPAMPAAPAASAAPTASAIH